jgi:hypothetical protein
MGDRMTPEQTLLDKLAGVRKTANGWEARCPAHDDRRASLSVSVGDDGRALVTCHAGCTTSAVLRSIGLTVVDLFPRRNGASLNNGKPEKADRRRFGTLKEAARSYNFGEPDHTWTYHDPNGEPVGAVLRWNRGTGKEVRPLNRHADGSWQLGAMPTPRPLFNLQQVLVADQVFVVEGEKCADELNRLGYIATTSSGGAGAAKQTDWTPLAGKDIVILPDNDEPGERYANDVAMILNGLSPTPTVKIVRLPGLPQGGDIVDWIDAKGDAAFPESVVVELENLIDATPAGEGKSDRSRDQRWGVKDFVDEHPGIERPIIHGLLRAGETLNLIGSTKSRKSWLATDLAFAVASGRPWLGFETERGNVLLFDNELLRKNLAYRLRTVAEHRGDSLDACNERFHVVPLRGRNRDIHGIGEILDQFKPGDLSLVIVDAFYRTLPIGVDENSNSDMTGIYNAIDEFASKLGSAFVLVHHSTKGSQSQKAVTDVGAGAGSQSRAVDAHVILRAHEQDDCVVLDAVGRSWRPLGARCLRWEWPVWEPDDSLDPAQLKSDRPRRRVEAKADPPPEAKPTWGVESFVAEFVGESPEAGDLIVEVARERGLSKARAKELLKLAVAKNLIHQWKSAPNRPVQYATRPPPRARAKNGPAGVQKRRKKKGKCAT